MSITSAMLCYVTHGSSNRHAGVCLNTASHCKWIS